LSHFWARLVFKALARDAPVGLPVAHQGRPAGQPSGLASRTTTLGAEARRVRAHRIVVPTHP